MDAIAARREHNTPTFFDRLLTPDGQRDESVLDFDANDVDRLFAQDFLIEECGRWPHLPLRTVRDWPSPLNPRDMFIAMVQPRTEYDRERSDDQLAADLRGLRNAILLPFCDDFNAGLQYVLQLAQAEADRRIAASREREMQRDRFAGDRWEDADLLAEVQAVAGTLTKRGRDWWGSCPFHEDKTPSMHVDPDKRIWHCFSCSRGGGVVAWRKAVAA